MDFTALVAPDSGQPAIDIELVAAADLAAWLERTPAASLARATGFKAEAGQVLIQPGSEMPAARIVVGTGSGAGDPWLLAVVPEKAPAGTYRLASEPDSAPELALSQRLACGWALAQYRFDRYKSAARTPEPRQLLLPAAADFDGLRREVEAVCLARDLVNTPACDLGPAELAAAVEQVGEACGATVRQIVGDELRSQGLNAIHAVGQAAASPPRLVDLHWGDPAHPKLTLVGKGVCFDSGGLDIKPSSAMLLMKKDMAGAAIALALARVIMQAGLPVRLRLLIPAVENAISGHAFRPGDIIATRKGLTVEVGNTDAEGRLILCDALALADAESPDALLDFATLTGAARVALGPEIAALFTPDDALASELATSGQRAADPVWRLPLWPAYADGLQSPVADLANVSDGPFAGSITAALFLQRFVTETPRWAHFDLYGWNAAAKPGRPKGGEATTLRACIDWVLQRYGSSARA